MLNGGFALGGMSSDSVSFVPNVSRFVRCEARETCFKLVRSAWDQSYLMVFPVCAP